jgi:hypothetical protein
LGQSFGPEATPNAFGVGHTGKMPVLRADTVKAGRRQSQKPEYLSGSPHSFAAASEKTSSQKEE